MASHTTLFVDNLPLDVGAFWFKKFFSKFGVVTDSFIPFKRSRRTGQRFGFVRYTSKDAADIAIAKTNGIWIENKSLITKFARYSKGGGNLYQNRVKDVLNPFGNSQQERGFCGGGALQNKTYNKFQSQTRSHFEERKTYSQVTKGVECLGEHNVVKSVQCHSIGSGWLYRSAIAKIRKLLTTKDLETVFNLEKVHDVQIKAIGGRYVVITFANEGTRDRIIKESWVMKWFEEIKPWNGEQAKEERFVWISCFGMPLSAWSSQTFKDIGNIWGDFIEVDENTLREGSYEKGRILIATNQTQKIVGNVALVEDGMKYLIRIEEEDSFRKVESNNFLTENAKVLGLNSESVNEVQYSQVPKEVHTLEKNTEEEYIDSSSNSTQGLDSFVEDSMGLQSLFHEAHDFEPMEKINAGKEVLNEPIVCDSENNIRASQIPGINLLVDFQPREVSISSSSEFEHSGNPTPSAIQSQSRIVPLDEFQLTFIAGSRLGIDYEERDAIMMKRMIESEMKEFQRSQRSSSIF